MTREALPQALSLTLTKTKVWALAGEAELPVSDLLDTCFKKESPAIAFRAAWVLEHVTEQHPERFLPYFPQFVQRLPEQQNYSCQRHFSKILMQFSNPKASAAYREALASITDREKIVEVIFDWLINPKTPVAVKVNCLEVLLNFSHIFPWIKDELQAQTEFYLKDGSPAMLARSKMILRQVSKV